MRKFAGARKLFVHTGIMLKLVNFFHPVIVCYSLICHLKLQIDGNDAWNIFTNTKNYLCQLGFNYWGDRGQIVGFESHDTKRGAFFIGENLLRNALINARSNNTFVQDLIDYHEGFQFYDTGSKLYLDNIIFRNFEDEEPVIKLLSFSDKFTPEGIAAVRNITYDNCIDPSYYIYDEYCGAALGCDNGEIDTQASRNFAMYDYDGSASQTGIPTIVTTHRDFWAISGDCNYSTIVNKWYCPWYEAIDNNKWGLDGFVYNDTNSNSSGVTYHNIAFLEVDIPGLTDGERVSNAESTYPKVVGYWSQFGRNYSTAQGIYPGIAGIVFSNLL